MAHWLGIDLGATNTKVAVVADDGWTILHQGHTPTDRRSPQHTVRACAELARRWVDEVGDVTGVGCTFPGLLDGDGTSVVVANLPGEWDGVAVREPLSQATGLPTTLINDARAFGLAESRLGAARGLDDVIGMVLGTGIGGVIVLGGEVFVGHNGNAGELGHQVLLPDGPPCGCGNRGCLEALARADAVALAAGHATVASAAEAARRGDEQARTALAEAGRWLGHGLANLVTVLTPQAVVVGGGVAQAGELLLGPLRRRLRECTPLVAPDTYQVLVAELGPLAGAVGAAVAASDAQHHRDAHVRAPLPVDAP